jgi:hypothetical protein
MTRRIIVLSRVQVAAFLLVAIGVILVACSVGAKGSGANDWIRLTYFVDATVEVQIDVPPAEVEQELNDMQFITPKDNSPVRMFSASYDPGNGRDRDLLLTDISGIVIRVDMEKADHSELTLKDIKNEIYVPQKNATRRFEYEGEQEFSGRKWLKVRLKGKPHGVAYSTPITHNLALILSMTIYGNKANETSLFAARQKTLEDVVSRVKVANVED